MAYASAYFLNWLAAQVAGQALTVKLHTGAPGNAGTANYAKGNNNRADGAPTVIAANAITATGAQSDNDQDVTLISPNATSAGQTIITHLHRLDGYWFGGAAAILP